MAKRNKRHKSKHRSKQKTLQKIVLSEPKQSADKSLKNAVIIECIKQVPFWWKQTQEFRVKIWAWIIDKLFM